MSQRSIREYDGKQLLTGWLRMNAPQGAEDLNAESNAKVIQINPSTDLSTLTKDHPWLVQEKLVAKPDMLIKRRGKANLLKLNATWDQAREWIEERRNKEIQVESVTGVLTHFLVEPFLPHEQQDEYYLCIQSKRDVDEIMFYSEGGINVGDVDAKAKRLHVKVGVPPSTSEITSTLLSEVPEVRRRYLSDYLRCFYDFFTNYQFAYLEVNPLVMTERPAQVVALDLAAKLDETARHECGKLWAAIEFPPAFGHKSTPEEEYISSLDEKTGSSLKLTVLKESARIWCMVAGGGASVIYADTLADFGVGKDLANYGEYSGAPSESLTFQYARTILDLMTRQAHPDGKLLFIGGGIANFTNVASTFKGIIRALREMAQVLRDHKIKIFVRRGGPNYQEGLKLMKAVGEELKLPIDVHGPETNLTSIVAMALNKPVSDFEALSSDPALQSKGQPLPVSTLDQREVSPEEAQACLFTRSTTSIVYGMQTGAVQNMLDFDFICGRETPSVSAIVYTFSANHFRKFYWGSKEIMLPVYQSVEEALTKFPQVDVVVNFASSRSVYDSTNDLLSYPQLRTIAIIAEGVPEKRTRQLLATAKTKNVTIIGPATVGGIKPGCFRIGNTGGMLDNIIASKLYRPGSVAYVSRSGGLSNELNNIISRTTDGVYEGIAIGGDRYPCTTFLDHLLRYQANPAVKMLVLLGEVGGTLEYDVCKALESGQITKPLVAWCTGTCASVFPYEVQFGHAGALAQAQAETAASKNKALHEAGAVVPSNFEDFATVIHTTYKSLGIEPQPEIEPPKIPLDYKWARQLGLIRRPAAFVSSITDERGDELSYAGMKISKVFEENLGVGGTLGLLWFRRRLPDYACRFIEMVLTVTADHGPAVAGAHNSIVTARAGKDLISSLCSGLLTIGPRFGGALDGAAEKFSWAYDSGLSPEEFVSTMRQRRELIMGIGHKIKSLDNPDVRVVLVKEYAKRHFPETTLLDYALEVEKVTTKKKNNLILNVDGCIGVAFVDLLRSCGEFTREEADEYVQMGTLNGLFVIGRSIGFVGHYLDQKRLKQGLYRHDTDDISYMVDASF